MCLKFYNILLLSFCCFSPSLVVAQVIINQDGDHVGRDLRSAIVASLKNQENYLHSGFWVYKISCFEPCMMPEEFNIDLFHQGLVRLKSEPSYARFQRQLFTRAQSDDIPTSQMVVLSRNNSELVLLDPMQCFAFSRQGYESHEFTRYHVTINGQLLAKEIVKRIFLPGNRGQELIRREIPGVDAVEEKRVKFGSYDTQTPEGALTSWQFGMGFDASASGLKPLSAGLSEWVMWYHASDEGTTNTLSLNTKQHQSLPHESLGYIKFQIDPVNPNRFMVPMEMAFNVAASGKEGKHIFIQGWHEISDERQSLAVPKRVIMARSERDASSMLVYDLVDFRPNMEFDKLVFSAGEDTSIRFQDDFLGMSIGGMDSLRSILSNESYTWNYCPDYSSYAWFEIWYGGFFAVHENDTIYFPCNRFATSWYDYGLWISGWGESDKDTVLKNGQFERYEYDSSSIIDWINTPPREGGRVQAQWRWVDVDEPPGAQDPGTITGSTSVVVINATFAEPETVPHRDNPDGTAYSIPVGCSLNPALNADELQTLKLTIWDPADSSFKKEWISTRSTIQENWNGKLSNGSNERYAQASNVFMRVTYTLKNLTFNSGSIDNSAVAMIIDGISRGELEAGSSYHFHYVTQGLDTIQTRRWTIDRAFKADRNGDILGQADLLDDNDKSSEAFDAKYVTGSKSSVGQTDLGMRSIVLSVTDVRGQNKITNMDLEVCVHRNAGMRAKLTGYYAVYENQTNNYGNDNNYDIKVMVDGTPYYFGHSFLANLQIEGTGKPCKLRTNVGLGYNPDGYDPSANQAWMEFDRIQNGVSYYRFSSTCSRLRQHGARFHTSAGRRSYYNSGAYNITEITDTLDLQGWVNQQIVNQRWFHDAPAPFGSNGEGSRVTIDDTGPFDNNINVDEKHIDIFYEASGENGIDPRDINSIIGTEYGTVKRWN